MDKALNGVVVADFNGVQVNGVVDVAPHVVVPLDVVVKALGSPLKLVAGETADETKRLLVFLCPVLGEGVRV